MELVIWALILESILLAGVRVLVEAGPHRDLALLHHRHTQYHHHFRVSSRSLLCYKRVDFN
jgi:hypothetical protein